MHVNIDIADAIIKCLNLDKERENKDPRQVSLGSRGLGWENDPT